MYKHSVVYSDTIDAMCVCTIEAKGITILEVYLPNTVATCIHVYLVLVYYYSV